MCMTGSLLSTPHCVDTSCDCATTGEGAAVGVPQDVAAAAAVVPPVWTAGSVRVQELATLADRSTVRAGHCESAVLLVAIPTPRSHRHSPAMYVSMWMARRACRLWHPQALAQRGGTGGNNRFTTEVVRWQPDGGAASYEMPHCPLRPPDATFDPHAQQFAQAWWTVRHTCSLPRTEQAVGRRCPETFADVLTACAVVAWGRPAGTCWCSRASTAATRSASSSWTQVGGAVNIFAPAHLSPSSECRASKKHGMTRRKSVLARIDPLPAGGWRRHQHAALGIRRERVRDRARRGGPAGAQCVWGTLCGRNGRAYQQPLPARAYAAAGAAHAAQPPLHVSTEFSSAHASSRTISFDFTATSLFACMTASHATKQCLKQSIAGVPKKVTTVSVLVLQELKRTAWLRS